MWLRIKFLSQFFPFFHTIKYAKMNGKFLLQINHQLGKCMTIHHEHSACLKCIQKGWTFSHIHIELYNEINELTQHTCMSVCFLLTSQGKSSGQKEHNSSRE